MQGELKAGQPLLQLLLVGRNHEVMQQCQGKRPEEVVVENEAGQH